MPKPQKVRHTRADIIARAEREFQQLDALVNGLRAEDWGLPVPRPETRAPWTIKDALAHIVYWKLHTARVIRGEKRPPEACGLDIEQLNQQIFDTWRNRAPAEVVEWHRGVHADVLRTLAAKPEDWFTRREHAPEWPADLDGHSAYHRVRDIEAALGQDVPPR
jgi:hypothetical protein